jgi:tetratricopeptide (TPR) repeat protein
LLLLLGLAAAAGVWRVTRAPDADRATSDPGMSRGLALLGSGDARGAAAAFAEVVQRRPDDADGCYFLGLARFRAGELRPAAAALQRSVRLRPGFVEGHRRLGQIYMIAREYSLAATELERARALAPHDATSLMQLGRLYLTTGEADRAASVLGEAVQWRPESGAAHALLGEAERLAGPARWNEAAGEFARALVLDPSNADAHHRLGWLALRSGHAQGALSHLRAAVRLDPHLAEAWYLLGQASQRAGRQDEARRAFAVFQQRRAATAEDGG